MSKGLHGEKKGKEEMGEKKAEKIDLTNLYEEIGRASCRERV